MFVYWGVLIRMAHPISSPLYKYYVLLGGAPCYPNPIFTSGQYSRVNSFLLTNGPLINCQSLSNYSQGAVTWSSGNYWRTAINTVTVSGNVNITGAAVATFGGNLVVVQNNFVATPTGNGLVLIRPSAYSGGEGIQEPTQADHLSEDALLIFPNPANEFITIKTTNTDSNTIISIYTSTMQLIKTVNFEAGIENIVSTINFSPVFILLMHKAESILSNKICGEQVI
ncbi:MAG: T9SS type A sorting domain-containing protein [Bacteroidetes bacterium]|nr:T9SS type A sorting domain-containing protein [Bacteroidota bacterium]